MTSPFGRLLKQWRSRRGWSQLELANRGGFSPRHLSFLETGRSRPGEAMVIRLAEELDLPLRDRNSLLEAAGFAPAYVERAWTSDALAPFRRVVAMMLENHAPFPAYVLDATWHIVDANAPARRLLPIGDEFPVDALELFCSPTWRAMLTNWAEVGWASLHEIRRDAARYDDAAFSARVARLEVALADVEPPDAAALARPVASASLRVGDAQLDTLTTVVRFGSVQDVTLEALRVELIFPASAAATAFFQAAG